MHRKSNAQYGARFVRLAVAIAVALAWLPAGAQAAAPTEYQLKAAFLLNFTKFVDWPSSAFNNPQSPIYVCVVGKDPFGRELDDILKGQSAGGHILAVRRIAQPQAEGCQVLFFSYGEREKFKNAINMLKNYPCLTVGEEDEFSQTGGMISLLIEDKKIRFEVNLDVAESAGLKISSRLLKLAKKVHDRRKS